MQATRSHADPARPDPPGRVAPRIVRRADGSALELDRDDHPMLAPPALAGG